MKVISVSHKGKRDINQDLILDYTSIDGSYLFAVIDGMGGYSGGEIAAKIVSENIETYLTTVDTIDASHIQKAINKSSLVIRQQNCQEKDTMGATIGGVIIRGAIVTYFWVGDVKILHFRNKKLLFQSTNHSLVNDLIVNGSITDPSKLSKYKHVVTRSIQGDVKTSQADIDSNTFYSNSDILFVCSDGVHTIFENLQIEKLLNQVSSPMMLKEKLESRLEKEANDNFTFGLIASNIFER